jgi:catechol 2,3-dioxygenase-like lactoylglutathione lyase family enzyme
MPAGEDALREALAFYVGALGFQEVPKPPKLAARGGAWFAAEGVGVHLGVEDPFAPARKAHPAFLVADLAAFRERLRQAGVDVNMDDAIPGVRRAYVHDPFGNRIELIDAEDGGFTNPAPT